MNKLPLYIPFTLSVLAIVAIFIFSRASRSKTTLLILSAWMLLQMLPGISGFYSDTSSMPPRVILMVGPPLLCIVLLFATRPGRTFLLKLDLKRLTWLHALRLPVEIVLLWLYTYKAIPRYMTFEGNNFDILSGLSAPIIYYFGYVKKLLNSRIILIWNLLCLGLLLNVVSYGILSVPYPFQQFGFEQPNIAVLYFPFVWLPAVIVPLVLLSHLAAIFQFFKQANSGK